MFLFQVGHNTFMDDKIASLILIGTLLIVFSYYGFLEIATMRSPTGESVKVLVNSTVSLVIGIILVIIALYMFSKVVFRKHNQVTIQTLSRVVRSPAKSAKKVVKKAKKAKKAKRPKKKTTRKKKSRKTRRRRR